MHEKKRTEEIKSYTNSSRSILDYIKKLREGTEPKQETVFYNTEWNWLKEEELKKESGEY